MGIYKEISKIWNFYGSDVHDEQQRTILKVRLYNLIGIILTPTLTLINLEHYSSYNIYFSTVIFLWCSLQFLFTYVLLKSYKVIADKVLYYSYYFYALYTLTDAFYKDFEVESTFGYIIILFAIIMVISTPKRVIAFLIFNFLFATPYIILANNTEIEKTFLWSFFFVFYLLGAVVIRGRHETARKLTERESLLKALFNQSYDAFFLVNFYSKEIVDCNNVAISLLQAKGKEDIVGRKSDGFKALPFTQEELVNIKQNLKQNGSWTSEQEYETIQGRKFIANVVITTLEFKKSNFYVVRITDLTEFKKSEKKLKLSEEKYRNLFERNLAGVYKIRSKDKMLLDCNDAFAKILGYSGKKEIVGEICSKLYVESSDNRTFHEFIKKQGQVYNHESKITLKDGSVIWAIENTTIVNDTNEPDYVEGTIIDITELKKAQQTLQQSERNRSLLLSSLNVVVYTEIIKETGKTIDYISPQIESVFGYTKESYNSGEFNVKNQYHPDDLKMIFTKTEKIYTTKKSGTLLYRFYHAKTGNQIWIEESIFPQYDKEEKHIANFGVARDVTERVEQEEALKHSEERFKQLSNIAIEGILFTENGITIDANEQYAKILGYDTVDEIMGKNMYEFISDSSKKVVEKYISSGRTENHIVVVKKKDGTSIYVETRGNYFHVGDRKIRASVISDVDEKFKKEKELLESEQRFKLLSEASQEGILIHNNGEILEVNDLLRKLVGYSKKELLGKNAYDLVEEKFRDIAEKKETEGTREPYQVNIIKKDQTTFQAEVQAREIPYQGKQVRVVAVRDITEKVISEQRLQERKRILSTLFSNLPGMAYRCLLDEKWTMKVVSQGCSRITGYNRTELINNKKVSYWDLIHKDFKVLPTDMLLDISELGSFSFEYKIIAKDGTEKWVLDQGEAIKDDAGNVIALEGYIADLSARKDSEQQKIRAELAEEINIELNKEIKERLRVEEELNTTQQYTKSIIESSLDVICATDEDGNVTEFNLAAQKTFGYSRGEVIGKNVSILYVDKSKTLGKQVKKTGFYAGEVLNKRKNGEEFISYLAASVLKNKKGKTIGLMGVSRDITEIRKAQKLLEQSEEQYRDLFENATDLIQSVDSEGKILFVNNSWKEALGYTDEEIKKINIFDIISPEKKAHCLEVFGKIFKGEKFDNIEVGFITKEGKEIIAEGNISVKYEDGKPKSTRGIFRNVTVNRIARNKLIEKEERLSAIINNTKDLILSIDENYNIIEYNQAVEKLVKHRYGKTVVPGMSVFETINPEWIEPFTAIYKKVFKGKLYREVLTAEEQGATSYFESFYNPIKNAEGKTTGIAIFSQDITSREINERKVKLALNEKEILLKEVHHRVKNNLQVVSSILNLQSAYIEDENILMLLSESQNRIKSMSFIHEALYQTKDFSSIDFKEYILNLSNNLIHSYQIYGDLVDLVLEVDKVLLNLDQAIPCGLIVNELFSNALKYAFEPNKKGSITISLTHNHKDEIKLIIKDNGKGLPDNFDFRKTESLGLQLVTTLVEQIDGTVNCETKKEKGTSFIIEFKKL